LIHVFESGKLKARQNASINDLYLRYRNASTTHNGNKILHSMPKGYSGGSNSGSVTMKPLIPASKSRNNLFLNAPAPPAALVKSSSEFRIAHTATDLYNEQFWAKMIPSAAYFHVRNSVLGDVFAMVYNNHRQDPITNKHSLSAFIIAKHGCSVHPSIDISPKSKYYPAVENLADEYKNSKVRKALAISLLKSFADLTPDIIKTLYSQADLSSATFDWDETMAGLLASEMSLIDTRTPVDVGTYLYDLGYLTPNLTMASYVVDVVYHDHNGDETLSERNNALAFLLGKQLEQLFDPLAEYSPEPTEKAYKPPTAEPPSNSTDSSLVQSICAELITVQTNYTVLLVQFLQNIVVPLRVQVLEGKIPGYTTSKLNQIFPPTIDEVTRINCILLDMLKLAAPYGAYEVLRACGTTIPYFYKAQMRHEAAIKNFHGEYNAFAKDMETLGRGELLTFDQRTIETAVYSSLNLVKLQLIIQRLVKNTKWPTNLEDDVQRLATSCDTTISSFANDKLQPYNGRIFTPTGKILTEIANGWPSELQYGWLTRRVVAVFDATDILTESPKNKVVIIIFSDHILVLAIDDDDYYHNLWRPNPTDAQIHTPSIADVLMHSLTNETPLSHLPHMKVISWASIIDVNALHYASALDAHFITGITNPNSYVRFFNATQPGFAAVYKMDKVSGRYVTEVVTRSKILNKSQSFHLFAGTTPCEEKESEQRVYYTAHEAKAYKEETTKSPFLVLFNEKYDPALLEKFGVYAFITLNFIAEETVRIEGLSRCTLNAGAKFGCDVSIDELGDTLADVLAEVQATHLSVYNPTLQSFLLANNGAVNESVEKVLIKSEENLQRERETIINAVEKKERERKIVQQAKSGNSINRRKSLEMLGMKKERENNKLEKADRPALVRKQAPPLKKKEKARGNEMKGSRFFSFFKSSKAKSATSTEQVKPRVINLQDLPERKPSVLRSRVSILKPPAEVDFSSKILKPAQPKQRKRESQAFANVVANVVKRSSSPSITPEPTPAPKTMAAVLMPIVSPIATRGVDRAGSEPIAEEHQDDTTMSTGIYVNSHFNFPMEEAPAEQFGSVKPRYAALRERGHGEGYKDSVDLMAPFKDIKPATTVGTETVPKTEPAAEPETERDGYDSDLFELVNQKETTPASSPEQTEIEPETNTNSNNDNGNGNVNGNEHEAQSNNNLNTTTDTPETCVRDSARVIITPADLDETRLNTPLVSLASPASPASPTKVNVWRAIAHGAGTMPPPPPPQRSLAPTRSESFYVKFKHLRQQQERRLATHGMSYVYGPDNFGAAQGDREQLSKDGGDKDNGEDDGEGEGENWIVIEEEKDKEHMRSVSKPISATLVKSESFTVLKSNRAVHPPQIQPQQQQQQNVSAVRSSAPVQITEDIPAEINLSELDGVLALDLDHDLNHDLDINIDLSFDAEMSALSGLSGLSLETAPTPTPTSMSMSMQKQTQKDAKRAQMPDPSISMGICDLTVGDLDADDTFNVTGIPASETLMSLNMLMQQNSYAYLADYLKDTEEVGGNDVAGKVVNMNVNVPDVVVNDHQDVVQDDPADAAAIPRMKRDETDYDLVYRTKLLQSKSMRYLTSYLG
jgi:hypothetical protein